MKIFETDSVDAVAELRCAFVATPFGRTLTACDHLGLCYAGFVVDGDCEAALADLSRRFPAARLVTDDECAVDIFGEVQSLHLVGTEFRRRVWRVLTDVKRGERISYSQLAERAGVPRAVRAVASAVASNPVSIVVPCHRIIRNDGSTGRYFWGSELKRRLLEAEER